MDFQVVSGGETTLVVVITERVQGRGVAFKPLIYLLCDIYGSIFS